jgi:hypothetical protein
MMAPFCLDARLVYAENDGQTYDGVTSISLSPDLTTISLDLVCADVLETDSEIHIRLPAASLDLEELRDRLKLLCNQAVEFIDNTEWPTRR